jgi:hypothetical protein
MSQNLVAYPSLWTFSDRKKKCWFEKFVWDKLQHQLTVHPHSYPTQKQFSKNNHPSSAQTLFFWKLKHETSDSELSWKFKFLHRFITERVNNARSFSSHIKLLKYSIFWGHSMSLLFPDKHRAKSQQWNFIFASTLWQNVPESHDDVLRSINANEKAGKISKLMAQRVSFLMCD